MDIKLNFSLSIQTDVILLYSTREDVIADYILKGISYQVVEPGTLFLHPKVLLRTIKLLRRFSSGPRFNSTGSVINLLKWLYEKNLQAFIESVAPKVVLTFIDDSGVFHRLNDTCKSTQFFAIQNGMRLGFYYDVILPNKSSLSNEISIGNYFCFGDYDVKNAQKYKSKIRKFSPVGSLIGGIYWGEFSEEVQPLYDVCYLSSYVGASIDSVKVKGLVDLWKSDTIGIKKLETNFKRLIFDAGYSVVIALKYDNSDEEKTYFYNIFGDAVTYQDSFRSDFSTYRAIDRSRLSLTGISTCAAEALGIGRRALFVNSLGYSGYRVKSAGFCYLEEPDYDALKNRIAHILSMSDNDYDEAMVNERKLLMNYDLNDLPHQKIRRDIIKALND